MNIVVFRWVTPRGGNFQKFLINYFLERAGGGVASASKEDQLICSCNDRMHADRNNCKYDDHTTEPEYPLFCAYDAAACSVLVPS